MKRFYQMSLAMSLFEQKQKPETKSKLNGLLYGARTILITLLPLVAATIFEITGSPILGSIVLIAFLTYVLAYYNLVFSKQYSITLVLPWRTEDWLVAVFAPTLLLLSFFQVIDTTTYLTSLLLLVSISRSQVVV